MVHFSKAPDLSGQRFGRLTVLRRNGSNAYSGYAYLCRCDCGTEKSIAASSLRRGFSTSCGCRQSESLIARSTTHGLHKHPLYRSWSRMKERCYYEKHMHFARYGGRGIRVCERWQEFLPFYEDNLPLWREGLTLDRIDNDSDYSPENCRWVNRTVQSRNRSNTIILTLNGKSQTLPEWANDTGLPENTIRTRLRNGWPTEKTLTTPHLQPHRRK